MPSSTLTGSVASRRGAGPLLTQYLVETRPVSHDRAAGVLWIGDDLRATQRQISNCHDGPLAVPACEYQAIPLLWPSVTRIGLCHCGLVHQPAQSSAQSRFQNAASLARHSSFSAADRPPQLTAQDQMLSPEPSTRAAALLARYARKIYSETDASASFSPALLRKYNGSASRSHEVRGPTRANLGTLGC